MKHRPWKNGGFNYIAYYEKRIRVKYKTKKTRIHIMLFKIQSSTSSFLIDSYPKELKKASSDSIPAHLICTK